MNIVGLSLVAGARFVDAIGSGVALIITWSSNLDRKVCTYEPSAPYRLGAPLSHEWLAARGRHACKREADTNRREVRNLHLQRWVTIDSGVPGIKWSPEHTSWVGYVSQFNDNSG